MVSREVLRRLATLEPSDPVLSVYARTDPRDPANTSATPAWQVELRNGLAATAECLEAGDDRDARLGFRELRGSIEEELEGLEPSERARSVAWFLDPSGATLERFSLQLPVRRDLVMRDARPFVSPLVDIADRGARTGVVLVTGEFVRLLQIEQAEPSEPDDALYELTLGDWRPYGGSAGGSPGRGVQTTSQQERFEARVDAQRDQLFDTAARATAKRLGDLAWERVVLVSERAVAPRFRGALPAELAERVVAEVDLNLAAEEPHVVADALEPVIEQSWRDRTVAIADLARERAQAGGAGAIGAKETLWALGEGRVEHLILDPAHDFSAIGDMIPPSIGGPPALLAERAVEAAVATAAQVTALDAEASDALREADGMAALLRY